MPLGTRFMRKATRSWFRQRDQDRRRKRRGAGKSGVYPPPGTVAPDKPTDARGQSGSAG